MTLVGAQLTTDLYYKTLNYEAILYVSARMAADQIKQVERDKLRVELLTNTSNIVKEYRKFVG